MIQKSASIGLNLFFTERFKFWKESLDEKLIFEKSEIELVVLLQFTIVSEPRQQAVDRYG